MKYFAKELGYGEEADFWGIVGLLHDLDFEKYPNEHCIKEQEILREHGIEEEIIHATASHGYALTVDIKPEHTMEKVLYAIDELTGLRHIKKITSQYASLFSVRLLRQEYLIAYY